MEVKARACRKGFSFVTAGLIVSFLLAEVALRLFSPFENQYVVSTLGTFAPDLQLGWVLKPNLRMTRKWGGRDVVIRTDANGHRIPDTNRESDFERPILVAGDSYVFGHEVNAEETFVYLLGQLGKTKTVNLGVGGYYLSQVCLSLRRSLALTQAQRALLVIYVGNDLQDGAYPPEQTFRVDQYGNLLTTASSFWDKPRSFILRQSLLAYHLALIRYTLVQLWKEHRENRHESWIYNPTAFTSNRLDEHRKLLSSVRDQARALGVPLTVVIMPERWQVYGSLGDLPNQRVAAMLVDLQIPFVDLLPAMKEAAAQKKVLWHKFYGGHLSPEGNQFVADILLEHLRRADKALPR